MTREQVLVYLNWAVYAIVGRMAEADQIYTAHSVLIEQAAAFCLNTVRPHAIHRGLILGEPGLTEIVPDHERTFISFSQDPNVARHFADPVPGRGFGFGPFPQLWPPFVDAKSGYFGSGYLIEYTPRKAEMLFHYSLLQEPQMQPAFVYLFSQISPSGEGESALKTFLKQREVILVNRGQVFPCRPFDVTIEYEEFVRQHAEEIK